MPGIRSIAACLYSLSEEDRYSTLGQKNGLRHDAAPIDPARIIQEFVRVELVET
jgi:hypothetical protein